MYERAAHLSVVPWSKDNPRDWPVVLTDIELRSEVGVPKTVYDHGERMKVRIRFDARERIESPNVMIAIVRSDGVGCSVYTTDTDNFDVGDLDGEGTLELTTPPLKLVAERYVIHVLFRMHGTQRLLCAQVGRTFHVRHPELDAFSYGVFHESGEWSVPHVSQHRETDNPTTRASSLHTP